MLRVAKQYLERYNEDLNIQWEQLTVEDFPRHSLDHTSGQVEEGFIQNISLITVSFSGVVCVCPLLSYVFLSSSWCIAFFFFCWQLIRHRCKKEFTERVWLARDQNQHKTIKIWLRKHYFIELDQGCNCFSACTLGFERTCK